MINLPEGQIKRIHVNKHIVGSNRRHGRNDPPLTVKVGRENHKGHSVRVNGPSDIVHRRDKPLKCGAVIWIETKAEVYITEHGGLVE